MSSQILWIGMIVVSFSPCSFSQGSLPQACQIDSSWEPKKKRNARKHIAKFEFDLEHISIEYAWHLQELNLEPIFSQWGQGPGRVMLVLLICQVMPKVLRHEGY